MKGKKATVPGVEFAEGVWFKSKPIGKKLAKLSILWEDGIYLGIKGLSGEIIVGTKEGIWKTRTIRRKPEKERWSPENSALIGGVPWKMSMDDEDEDGSVPQGVLKEMPAKRKEESEEHKQGVAEPVAPKSFQISREDLEKFGYTDGCAACRAILRGRFNRQSHGERCRERMRKELLGTSKVKDAKKRENEYLEKAVEKAEREGKKVKLNEKKAEDAETKAEEKKDEKEVVAKRGHAEESGSSASTDTAAPAKRSKTNAWVLESDADEVLGICHVNQEPVEWDMLHEAFDDLTGEKLDAEKVKSGRLEEVDFLNTRGIWEPRPRDECLRKTGKHPTSVKWVDVAKNDAVRCRLVARNFKPKKTNGSESEFFASMPPLEAKEILMSEAASQVGTGKVLKMLFLDVTKAHLNGVCDDEGAYVKFPEEAQMGDRIAKLKFWLYGMRPAARGWEEDYAKRSKEEGFAQGKANATIFHNKELGIKCVVHGNDFTFLGEEVYLKSIVKLFEGWYEFKVLGILRPEPKDQKSIVILGRTMTWEPWGVRLAADAKHAKKITDYFSLDQDSKGLEIPGLKWSQ